MNAIVNVPVRSSAILVDPTYVAGSVIGVDVCTPAIVADSNQLVLHVNFTKGSLTTAEVKVEFSFDGTTWAQETFSSISTGTATESLGLHQFGATGVYQVLIDYKARFIRVSAKGTGTASGSLMAITAALAKV